MSEGTPESVSLMRYTEFEHDPEAAIDHVNETGNSIIVTSNGRFMFLIEPLISTEIHIAPEN